MTIIHKNTLNDEIHIHKKSTQKVLFFRWNNCCSLRGKTKEYMHAKIAVPLRETVSKRKKHTQNCCSLRGTSIVL